MSLILLVVGALLFYMGRVDIGTLRAEGRRVKAAGIILAAPGFVSLILTYFAIPMSFGNNPASADTALGLVGLIDLVGTFVAVGLAYILIADPTGAPRLPGILGEWQNESRPERPTTNGSSEPPAKTTTTQTRPTETKKTISIPSAGFGLNPRSMNRDQFPAVMNLKQAARYLQVSEDEVLQLIDEGKLTAARDNYNYKIAKSQLDELL